MNVKRVVLIAFGLIIIAGCAIVLFSNTTFSANPSRDGLTSLPAVEVRSYQGKDLSSITAFHENSIKGPQQINTSDYRLTITGLTNKTDIYTLY